MTSKIYAMSSFLQLRAVYDKQHKFADKIGYPKDYSLPKANKVNIECAKQLCNYLEEYVQKHTADGRAAIALSGGIDSAIVAKYMPKNSVAYTLKCSVPGFDVVDETTQAQLYCKSVKLEQRIVEVTFEDYLEYSPQLMIQKAAPIHSIEPQIYKMARQAKRDGLDRLIFADNADMVFGGLDSLLRTSPVFGDFLERFSYVMPYKVLKEFVIVTEPFEKWSNAGLIDKHSFLNDVFSGESTNSYLNACTVADVEFIDPFSNLYHDIDLDKIYAGDPKYIVREAFNICYPDIIAPKKIPMHRAVDEWFRDWKGPSRAEFIPNCHFNMTGNEKYYVWILEQFLNLTDGLPVVRP